MNNKCLVCWRRKSLSDYKCKMCAMGIKNEIKFKGFRFCSTKCRVHFQKIWNISTLEERKGIENLDSLI